MGAADLLLHVRTAGFVLDSAAGNLLVTPASMLTDKLITELRAFKPALLALLAAEALHEAFEERAAILEFDGGMSRVDAEDAAAALTNFSPSQDRSVRCLTCLHRSRRATCLRPVAAGVTTSFEIVWCELLPDGPVRPSSRSRHDTSHPREGLNSGVSALTSAASSERRRIEHRRSRPHRLGCWIRPL